MKFFVIRVHKTGELLSLNPDSPPDSVSYTASGEPPALFKDAIDANCVRMCWDKVYHPYFNLELEVVPASLTVG